MNLENQEVQKIVDRFYKIGGGNLEPEEKIQVQQERQRLQKSRTELEERTAGLKSATNEEKEQHKNYELHTEFLGNVIVEDGANL